MKKFIQLLIISILLFATACSKSGSEVVSEENLVLTLTPDPGSSTTPVKTTSATYTFTVATQSKFPAQGITVKVEYVTDGGTVVFTQTQTITTSPASVTITGIPFNELGTVTITVTSVATPSNTVTKTFKLVRK